MEDHDIRAALDHHWAASDANDFEAEHQIYREDAVLDYPQSGARIRGRRNIQAPRFAQPSRSSETRRWPARPVRRMKSSRPRRTVSGPPTMAQPSASSRIARG